MTTDYLKDKPKGICPWCGETLITELEIDEDLTEEVSPFCTCQMWDKDLDEDTNRDVYVEMKENEAVI